MDSHRTKTTARVSSYPWQSGRPFPLSQMIVAIMPSQAPGVRGLCTLKMRPTRSFAQAGPSDYMRPEERGRPRAQPSLEVVDLTSPRRQATNGEWNRYALLHERSMIDPRGYSRVPIVSRQQPARQVGGSQYEVIAGEPPRTYMPDSGMYAGRAPPARDYIPVSDHQPRQHVEFEGARYLRSGVQYGGHNVR
jgi:hypothetical protein